MDSWKLIFKKDTGRGSGFGREPMADEFAVDLPLCDCGSFTVDPSKYQYNQGVFSEVAIDILAAEQKKAEIAAMWERIKAERDTRKAGGFLVSGKWFNSDQESRVQQIGLVMAGAALSAVQWKTMDGTFAVMTPALAGQIFQAGFALDTALFTRAEQHKAAMSASLDPTAYDYSTGWPERYADGL